MNQESKHDIKEKIRQRYKGGDSENMHMIPARVKETLFGESTPSGYPWLMFSPINPFRRARQRFKRGFLR